MSRSSASSQADPGIVCETALAGSAPKRTGEAELLQIQTVETPELGDRSYLAHDGREAVVVDPQRDIDRVLRAAQEAGVDIRCVAETHIHNDYVSGGLELAREVGASYLVAAQEEVGFERRPVADGERLRVGSMVLEALATPGHTPNHLSFLLSLEGRPRAVFSGGSLLYGAVGRTDLISPAATEELAHAQHRSARRLAQLPDATDLYPTHGFGSFCSSGGSGSSDVEGAQSIGRERGVNPALEDDDEEGFVRRLLGGYTLYPSYYAEMGGLNRAGAGPIDLSLPPEVGVEEVGRRIAGGEWVLDLRPRPEFAADHVAGTVNFPTGMLLATYVGWVVPWGAPLTLLGAEPGPVERARRDLARIGVERLEAWCPRPLTELERRLGGSSYRVTDFRQLAREWPSGEIQVLDARRPDEWRAGHIRGAINIHLPELERRLSELPRRSTWVHCAAGYRASIAASILDRAGRDVVLVDDDFANLAGSGIDIETGG